MALTVPEVRRHCESLIDPRHYRIKEDMDETYKMINAGF
jgi:hypothetical protein